MDQPLKTRGSFDDEFPRVELRQLSLRPRHTNVHAYAYKGTGVDPEVAEPGACVNQQEFQSGASINEVLQQEVRGTDTFQPQLLELGKMEPGAAVRELAVYKGEDAQGT
jgi:hypothetical protein